MSAESSRAHLPTGTVTFVFTDIEGSTQLVKSLGAERWADVLEAHGRIVRAAVLAAGGVVLGTEGDSFFCVFRTTAQAAAATVTAQRDLAAAKWPHDAVVRVRMGMHAGEGVLGPPDSGVDYVGIDVHRAARVAASGHGGQVLVSETAEALVRDHLPPGTTLLDLGRHRFKDLGQPERVWQLAIEGLPSTFPRIKSLDRTPNSLPTQLTSFIGREDEIREGLRLLAGTRLLTLTGPGGTGKTRLSLQMAAAASDDFPDGVHFVALASIVDPDLVVPTIAHELGIQLDARRSPLDRLVDFLGTKRVLVVTDNFEQVLAAAPRLGDILRGAPNVKILVSSRAALRLDGEQEMPVPPLDLPDPKLHDLEAISRFEAVHLFVERARASKPSFALTEENAPTVVAICARLDGLPLAIELAAASLRMLGPGAILARLEKSLALPSGGPRDRPARQQTLRGAIEWSHDLLTEPERRLFRVLSVFAGGATLDRIEAAFPGDEVLATLGSLVDHSLVRQHEVAGETRFFMLQTVRDFALEALAKSDDAEAVRRRHAEAYRDLAEAAAPRLATRDRTRVLDGLQLEIDNFRAALEWAIAAKESDVAMRLANALWRLWQARGYLAEARGTIARVLDLPCDADSPIRASTLETAGGIAYWQGDQKTARDLYARALEACRRRCDDLAIANACYNLSFTFFLGADVDLDRAFAIVDEALRTYRRLDDRPGTAKTLWSHAQVHSLRGNLEAALVENEESVAIFRSLDDPFGLAWSLRGLAWNYLKARRFEEARKIFEEILRIFSEARDLSGITLILDDFSQLEATVGQPQRAIKLTAASAALRSSTGVGLSEQTRDMYQKFEAAEKLSPEAVEAAWAEGVKMNAEAAVAFALGARVP